jgi:hypothetical protein
MATPVAAKVSVAPTSSRWVTVPAIVLTAIGVLGTWIDFFAMFVISGHGPSGGCGGLIGILLLVLLVIVILLGFIAVLALSGALLLRFRPGLGPPLLIAANLLVMGFDGFWRPINAGQLAWGLSLVALATVPALAIVLMLWPLLTRGRVWVRVLEVAVLGLLAWPMLWLYAYGMSDEISLALQQPVPVAVASSTCGGGGG